MSNHKKGCTLKDQIYKEGESTWGCKLGVLDVEDVLKLLNDLMSFAKHNKDWKLVELLEEWGGFALNTIEETNGNN